MMENGKIFPIFSIKGRGQNNFLKLALRFRLDLFYQIRQRWPENEKRKWESYFVFLPKMV